MTIVCVPCGTAVAKTMRLALNVEAFRSTVLTYLPSM